MLKVRIDTQVFVDGQWQQEGSHRVVNHDDFEDRKWMGRHCFWAFRNGRRIITTPVSELSLDLETIMTPGFGE